MHKFLNKLDFPWVSLIWEKLYPNGKLPNHTMKVSFLWRDNSRLLPTLKSLAKADVKNGKFLIMDRPLEG